MDKGVALSAERFDALEGDIAGAVPEAERDGKCGATL
jgi:hypothetical protein